MSRATPYVSRPSEALRQRLTEAASARLFVVQAPGPTSFVLRPEASERQFRVSIGNVHTCSCGAREHPCQHIAFVLIRVFRLGSDDPRTWQQSLIDSELEALVNARERYLATQRLQACAATDTLSTAICEGGSACSSAGKVPRIPLDPDEGDSCPICYEDMTIADEQEDLLDWCKLSCGKSLHRRCLRVWADHQASISKSLTCPLCRSSWMPGPLGEQPAPAAASSRSRPSRRAAAFGPVSSSLHQGPMHRLARCRSCRSCPIYGVRYRCLECDERLELCEDCFANGLHANTGHPFAQRARPGALWSPAPTRARPPPLVLPTGVNPPRAPPTIPAATPPGRPLSQALLELQHREIGPDDYDLLLALAASEGGAAAASAVSPYCASQADTGEQAAEYPSDCEETSAGSSQPTEYVLNLVAALNEREAERQSRTAAASAPCCALTTRSGRHGASGSTVICPGQRESRIAAECESSTAQVRRVSLGLAGLALPLAMPNRSTYARNTCVGTEEQRAEACGDHSSAATSAQGGGASAHPRCRLRAATTDRGVRAARSGPRSIEGVYGGGVTCSSTLQSEQTGRDGRQARVRTRAQCATLSCRPQRTSASPGSLRAELPQSTARAMPDSLDGLVGTRFHSLRPA